MTRSRRMALFEFAVVVAMIGALSAVLLNRLHYYQEVAEKSDMEYTVGAIKSALRMRMATMMVEGHAQEFHVLAEQNPMDWLDQKPHSYRGSLANPTSKQVQPGSWYFDSTKRCLVYVLERGDQFLPNSGGQKRVRWQMTILRNQFDPMLQNGAAQATDSVALRLVEPYKWF